MGAPVTDQFERRLRDLRVSVTDRCNFRCPYCMPAEVFNESYGFLPKQEILSFEEIERLARAFVALGVRKLRLTGGEPLLRRELPKLIERLARIEGVEDLSLTTNGSKLAEWAQALKDAGLRRVTVSLDSLDPEVFRRMNDRGLPVERVLEGIAAAERAGLSPIKLNCVVRRGINDHTIAGLASHFRGTGHIVRFIEFMDVGTMNGWDLKHVVPKREILQLLSREAALEPVPPGYPGEVATRWRYADGSGEVGIIASVSEPFCKGCTRARLTADGRFVTCLFANGGPSLRDPLRAGATDEELRARISAIWTGRTDRYSEQRSENTDLRSSKIEMYQIGG
ncbi:MAG: GTP 3',8-cyclase MoaA [Planctomycetota bacterium]|nr:GTP 3',8-cyclase MoaA [Planctomycetota bacterium]